MAYSGAYKEDRAKALVGVAAVHVLLAAVILTGLNVRNVQHVVESLKTFDIKEIVPPPPPPPPQPKADRAKAQNRSAGQAAGRRRADRGDRKCPDRGRCDGGYRHRSRRLGQWPRWRRKR